MDDEQRRLFYGDCSCGAPGEADAICPYAAEFASREEDIAPCNCCHTCTQQCANDI